MDAIILVLLRSFGIVFGIAIVIVVASLVIICIDVDKKEKEAKRDKEIHHKQGFHSHRGIKGRNGRVYRI